MKNLESIDKQHGKISIQNPTLFPWPLPVGNALTHTLLWIMAFDHHNNPNPPFMKGLKFGEFGEHPQLV